MGVAGWNTSAACSEHVPVFVAGGLARCWVLRGHLCVVGVFLGAASGSAVLTRAVVRGGGGEPGCGCVLSVA